MLLDWAHRHTDERRAREDEEHQRTSDARAQRGHTHGDTERKHKTTDANTDTRALLPPHGDSDQ